MTTTSDSRHPPTARLRQVLGLNAATSAAAGLVSIVGPAWVAGLLGIDADPAPLVIRLVGMGLVIFALDVVLTARTPDDRALRRWTGLISGADIAWVLATAVLVAVVDFSTVGTAVAVAMGSAVAGLAGLQLQLRRP